MNFYRIKTLTLQFFIAVNIFLLRSSDILGGKTLIINLLFLIGILLILLHRNHLLNYLILIEFFIILVYFIFLIKASSLRSSISRLFFFIVVIVCGACTGMSLLVIITRLINNELEFINLMLPF